jgi:hypothetical protein
MTTRRIVIALIVLNELRGLAVVAAVLWGAKGLHF